MMTVSPQTATYPAGMMRFTGRTERVETAAVAPSGTGLVCRIDLA